MVRCWYSSGIQMRWERFWVAALVMKWLWVLWDPLHSLGRAPVRKQWRRLSCMMTLRGDVVIQWSNLSASSRPGLLRPVLLQAEQCSATTTAPCSLWETGTRWMTHCPAPVSPLLRNVYSFGFGFVVMFVFMFANKTLNSGFKKGSERRDKRAGFKNIRLETRAWLSHTLSDSPVPTS